MGGDFVGADGVAGEAVFGALDVGAGEDGLEDGALGLADFGRFAGELEEGAVAEDDAGGAAIGDFEAGEVAVALGELEHGGEAGVVCCGGDVVFGELDLLVDDAGEDAVEELGGFAADSGDEGEGDIGVLLGEEAFAAGGEAEDVAGAPGAFAYFGEGDDALGFEGEEVLADGAGGQVGFAGELVGRGFAEGFDGHDECLAGGAQVLEAAAVWRFAPQHGATIPSGCR